MDNKFIPFLIVIALLGWGSAYRQHNGARYWEGRAEREIERAETSKRVATYCVRDLHSLQVDLDENTAEVRRIRRGNATLSASLDSYGARTEAFENAVRRRCPALAAEIMPPPTPEQLNTRPSEEHPSFSRGGCSSFTPPPSPCPSPRFPQSLLR